MYSNKVWLKTIIILFALIFFTGCSDNAVQVQQIETQDEILSREIIGTWKAIDPWKGSSQRADWYRIDFRTDGTYTDTIYNAFKDPQTTDTVTIITSGNYTIQNQVLEYANVSFSYKTSSGQPFGFINSKLPQFISLTGDSLSMQMGLALSTVDSTANLLKGTWNIIFWYYMSSNDSLTHEYSGRRENIYIFGNDSSYTEIWKYPDRTDWSGQTWYGSYYYDPPELRTLVGGYEETKVVEFHAPKMYWHFNYQVLKMDRIY